MQNLLPLLALRPRTVVQVRSREDRFHQAAENLKCAVLYELGRALRLPIYYLHESFKVSVELP